VSSVTTDRLIAPHGGNDHVVEHGDGFVGEEKRGGNGEGGEKERFHGDERVGLSKGEEGFRCGTGGNTATHIEVARPRRGRFEAR